MGREKLWHLLGNLATKLMQQKLLRQRRQQTQDPKSTIKHGGLGKTLIFTRRFSYKTDAAEAAAPAAAADTWAKKYYKTRWAGKSFDF